MSRRKRKTPAEQYTPLAVRVERYSADISAGISHDARDKRFQDDDVRIYRFASRLEIEGVCTYPDDRRGEQYQITVYGEQPGERDFDATLGDIAERDEDGARRYRKIRGQLVPLYKDPYGLGMLDKQRGTNKWYGWLWVPEATTAQMLTLLVAVRPLYMDIQERKIERKRWINAFGLQTTDPAEE